MNEKEVKEIINFYFIILLIFTLISLLRTLFILNYKLIIKNNRLYFHSLLEDFSFDLKEIKKVDLLTFHIYIEIYNSKRFYLIPLGFNNIHIVYRLLIENCDFNNIFNNFTKENIIYNSKDEIKDEFKDESINDSINN